MYCHHPLEMHKSPSLTVTGKRGWTFDLRDSLDPDRLIPEMHIQVPCGQCIACRVRKAQEWSARLWLEWKSSSQESCFLTLTYDDEHLPCDRSLRVQDYQLFLKRLRKQLEPVKIRYYCAGEYGSQLDRPHYHLILFGTDFGSDKLPLCNVFNRLHPQYYISSLVAQCWPMGYHTIAPLSDACICYVAKYVIKKAVGRSADDWYAGRLPEFGIGSKGIARAWYDQNHDNMWDKGFFRWGDRFKKCRPVRYYEKILEKNDFDRLTNIKQDRIFRHLWDRKEVFYPGEKMRRQLDERAMAHNYKLFAESRHKSI